MSLFCLLSAKTQLTQVVLHSPFSRHEWLKHEILVYTRSLALSPIRVLTLSLSLAPFLCRSQCRQCTNTGT